MKYPRPKFPRGPLRDRVVSVRFSAEEFDEMRRRIPGGKVSAYIRRRALEPENEMTKPAKESK